MIKIIHYNELNENFEKLNNFLDKDLYERFGEITLKYRFYNTLEGIEDFFVAYEEENAVACGCIKKTTDEVVELKRVYVLPGYRRKGIANLIVNSCEEVAKEKNYHYIRLETGVEMSEAIQLYKKRNYNVIENYGDFIGDEICCCMEKKL